MRRLLQGTETRRWRMLNRNVVTQTYVTTLSCKFCKSISIVRYGLTKKGEQRFLCQKCKSDLSPVNNANAS